MRAQWNKLKRKKRITAQTGDIFQKKELGILESAKTIGINDNIHGENSQGIGI